MLERCQPDGWHQRNKPAYIGCSVHPDFIKFQDFAEWCQYQIGFGEEDFQLDKDILVPGNKVYGPDTCCFIPKRINLLMVKNYGIRGDLPVGVWYDAKRDKYCAGVSVNNRTKKLGRFDTPEQAYAAYVAAKTELICQYLNEWKDQIDPRVYAALAEYVPE